MRRIHHSRFMQRLLAGAAFAFAFAACQAPMTAAAAAPQQQAQVPGYYRLKLGELEVTALNDGNTHLKVGLLHGADAHSIEQMLERMYVPSGGQGVRTAINGFLVNTGQQLALVDAGGGSCLGAGAGHLLDNLRAAGYQPEQVDAVLLTHLHGDHACGLITADGKPAFPNATVYLSQAEAGFWLDPAQQARAQKSKQAAFKRAQDALAPYRKAGRMKEFKAGDSPIPGVVSVAEPGHTPGHTGYLFTSEGGKLLVWGDIVHSHAVQFGQPQVALDFDSDQSQAIATRKRLLAQAAEDKRWIAGAHLPFPGIGHVRAEGDGYAWVPLEFGPLQ